MSIYDRIAASLKSTVTSISERASQFRNQSFADASMAALALVSMSDGVLQPEERTGVVRCIQNIKDLQYFQAEGLRDSFDASCRQVGDAFGRIEVVKKIRRVRDNADQADVVVKICIIVCKTKGGQLADCERDAIREVIREVGLLEQDYDLGAGGGASTTVSPAAAAPSLSPPARPVPAASPPAVHVPTGTPAPQTVRRPRQPGNSLRLLKPGERVSLKAVSGASVVRLAVGFGWEAPQSNGLTVQACLFGSDKQVLQKVVEGVAAPGLEHAGNTSTTSVMGDDEELSIDFSSLSAQVASIVFFLSPVAARATLAAKSAWMRLVDPDKKSQLIRFDFGNPTDSTTLVFGRIYLNNGDWKVAAVGEAIRAGTPEALQTQIATFA